MGFKKAIQADQGCEVQVFNLGTGQEISTRSLAQMIINLSGKNVPVKLDEKCLRPAKPEVPRLLSNNTNAREQLGWRPEVFLENGIQQTIRWVCEHLKNYSPDVYAF